MSGGRIGGGELGEGDGGGYSDNMIIFHFFARQFYAFPVPGSFQAVPVCGARSLRGSFTPTRSAVFLPAALDC